MMNKATVDRRQLAPHVCTSRWLRACIIAWTVATPGGCRCQRVGELPADDAAVRTIGAEPAAQKPTQQAAERAPEQAVGGSLFGGLDEDELPDSWPGVPVDVLVLARAPLLDPGQVGARLARIAAALRDDPRVEHVWTRGTPGEGRILARFAAPTTAGDARALVAARLAKSPLAAESLIEIATIGRGAHAAAAFSVTHPGGRKAATAKSLAVLRRALSAITDRTRLSGCGLVRDFTTLRLLPTALANMGVTIDDSLGAATQALATHGDLNARLSGQQVARTRGTSPLAVNVGDLVNRVGGTGAPWACEALVGASVTTVVLVDTADGASDRAFAESTAAMAKLKRSPPAGAAVFHHHLNATTRLMVRATRAAPEPAAEMAKRLRTLAAGDAVVDLLAIQRADGIPRRLDPEAIAGRVWTLWAAFDDPGRIEVHLTTVRETLAPGGWAVHPLPPRHDTGLAWLLGVWGTAGVAVAARDPRQLAGPVSALADVSRDNPSVTQRRSGPRRTPAPSWWAALDRAKAAAAIDGRTLAAVLAVSDRAYPVGRIGDVDIGLQLHGGSGIAGLPIGKSATWQSIQALPSAQEELDRITRDGMSALWYVEDSASPAADELARDFWQVVERRVGPHGQRILVSLRLGDAEVRAPVSPR